MQNRVPILKYKNADILPVEMYRTSFFISKLSYALYFTKRSLNFFGPVLLELFSRMVGIISNIFSSSSCSQRALKKLKLIFLGLRLPSFCAHDHEIILTLHHVMWKDDSFFSPNVCCFRMRLLEGIAPSQIKLKNERKQCYLFVIFGVSSNCEISFKCF